MDDPRIIAVGASAGGVQALSALASSLPKNLTVPILVVMHIPAVPQTQLPSILGRSGALPVKQAEEGEHMRGGCIYVAPNDRHLLVDGNCLRLSAGPKENRVRPSVDALFRSVAASFGSGAIGVVLSGMLDDGTAGLWAIKARGGIAVVQTPEEAMFSSMPESALKHVDVDYAVGVDEMPALFMRLLEMPVPESNDELTGKLKREIEITLRGDALQRGVMQLGDASSLTCPECHGVLVEINNGPIVRYRCHTGHAFSSQSLLSDVDDAIEASLYGAMRAIEERALLLKRLGAALTEKGDDEGARKCARESDEAAERAQQVKTLVLKNRAREVAG